MYIGSSSTSNDAFASLKRKLPLATAASGPHIKSSCRCLSLLLQELSSVGCNLQNNWVNSILTLVFSQSITEFHLLGWHQICMYLYNYLPLY